MIRIIMLMMLVSCNFKQIKSEIGCYEDDIIKEETGRISYYEYSCNRCRKTGSGDIYDHNGYTIAYYDPNEPKRKYYGCHAMVINLNTCDTVYVKINDSGMFREGKYSKKNIIVDASPKVFESLGFTKRQGIGNNIKIVIWKH